MVLACLLDDSQFRRSSGSKNVGKTTNPVTAVASRANEAARRTRAMEFQSAVCAGESTEEGKSAAVARTRSRQAGQKN